MIYGPRGEVVSESAVAAATRKIMLQAASNKLLFRFSRQTRLGEAFMVNDLRKSCGVEPKKATIRFKGYSDLPKEKQ